MKNTFVDLKSDKGQRSWKTRRPLA